MKILFFSDNFPSETNAIANRVYERALHWVEAGHSLTVITSVPNFPEGVVHEGYQNRWRSEEEMDGIRVIRVKTFIAPNKGFAKRTLDFLSYMLTSFWAALWEPKPDVIAATSPQFFAAVSAWASARLKRIPFVLEIGDLWPASIVAVGAMKKGRLIRMLEAMEFFLYRQATRIVALTASFKAHMTQGGIDPSKIDVIQNGVELRSHVPVPLDGDLASELGLHGAFVVGYIGTFGMAHGLDNVLAAFEALQRSDDPSASSVRMLFVGAGADREHLVSEATRRRLSNVVFVARQPKPEIPRYWSLCDLALVHLRDTPAMAEVIPSKIFEAMAMRKPILIAAPTGEASSIVQAEGAGIAISSSGPDVLASAILQLRAKPEQLRAYAEESAEAAPRHSRQRQAELYAQTLESAVDTFRRGRRAAGS